jgi:hypothetical protein
MAKAKRSLKRIFRRSKPGFFVVGPNRELFALSKVPMNEVLARYCVDWPFKSLYIPAYASVAVAAAKYSRVEGKFKAFASCYLGIEPDHIFLHSPATASGKEARLGIFGLFLAEAKALAAKHKRGEIRIEADAKHKGLLAGYEQFGFEFSGPVRLHRRSVFLGRLLLKKKAK